MELNILTKMYMFYKLHNTPFVMNFLNNGKEATELYFSKIKPS